MVSIKQGWLWVNKGFTSLLSIFDHPFATHDLGFVAVRLEGSDIDLDTLEMSVVEEREVGGTDIDRDMDWYCLVFVSVAWFPLLSSLPCSCLVLPGI